MDAVKSFFKKYDAVPANLNGPQWSHASDESILRWSRSDCRQWDRSGDGIRSELRGRMEGMHAECVIRGLAEMAAELASRLW